MAKMLRKLKFVIEIILGGGLVCFSLLAMIGFVLFPNREPQLQTTMQAAYMLVAAALILGAALICSGVRHARACARVLSAWQAGEEPAIIAKAPFDDRPGDEAPSPFAWLLWALCVLIFSAGIVIWFWRR
jgi:hypothetical protein